MRMLPIGFAIVIDVTNSFLTLFDNGHFFGITRFRSLQVEVS